MEIRHIEKSDDRFAISRIYEESWKFAYKDIVPQDYLDSIPAGRWAPCLDQEGVHSLVVIEDDIGKSPVESRLFVGTSAYSRSRSAEFENFGEIISLYLLPQYIGKGYGKLLLDAVVGELAELGFRDIFLWALEDNQRARKFYERNGFTLTGYRMDHMIDNMK